MIVFPKTLAKAAGASKAAGTEIRAGATDLAERRHLGVSRGNLVDLRDVSGMTTIAPHQGGLRVGGRVTIAALATHADVRAGYPGLAQAAGGLATPQIRAVGTIAGNLLQHTRCWYYRNPDGECFKKGGKTCAARDGDHLFHACFDLGPCVSVHASTLAMALMAYEATVFVHEADDRSVEALLGDGTDPRRHHRLEPGDVLAGVELPPPTGGERAAYFRAISRARAEWPLVEAIVRLVVGDGNRIDLARVAIGGVAPVPLRLPKVEAALEGHEASAAAFERAAALASAGAKPLPMTQYKVELIPATVLTALELALESRPVAVAAPPPAEPAEPAQPLETKEGT